MDILYKLFTKLSFKFFNEACSHSIPVFTTGLITEPFVLQQHIYNWHIVWIDSLKQYNAKHIIVIIKHKQTTIMIMPKIVGLILIGGSMPSKYSNLVSFTGVKFN